MRAICRYISLLYCFALFAGCTSGIDKPVGKKLIVCTTGYVGDLVKKLVGPEAVVVTLMGPGVDPHLYKAGLRDVDYLAAADLIVSNGLHLEGKMTGLLEKMSSQKKVFVLSDGLKKEQLLYLGGEVPVPDPHIWFDASLWKAAGSYFCTAYTSLEWSSPKDMQIRCMQFAQLMDSLHNMATAAMQSIPEKRRYLVTAHDAFGYFSRAYGIKVRALQGISTQSEFGLRDITELQNFLIRQDIPSIFIESSVPRKAIDAIIEGCRTKGFTVRVGGELYSDALGSRGTPEGVYEGVFMHNVQTITSNLRP